MTDCKILNRGTLEMTNLVTALDLKMFPLLGEGMVPDVRRGEVRRLR